MPPKSYVQRIKERNVFYLMRVGRKAAIAKGHQPGSWKIWPDNKGALTACKRCGMPLGVLTHPYPIETAVSGTALAFVCPKNKRNKKGK